MKAKLWTLDAILAGPCVPLFCPHHVTSGNHQVLPYFLVCYFDFRCICWLSVAVTDTQEKRFNKGKALA